MNCAYHEQLKERIANERRLAIKGGNWAERIWREGRASALEKILAEDVAKVQYAQEAAKEVEV